MMHTQATTGDDDTLLQPGTTEPTSTLVEVLAGTSLSRVQHDNLRVQDDT